VRLDALLISVDEPEPANTYDLPLDMDREAIVPAVRIWRADQPVWEGAATMPLPNPLIEVPRARLTELSVAPGELGQLAYAEESGLAPGLIWASERRRR